MRDVVAAADIVEVVGLRTSLARAGTRYIGRCPFHEERSPSSPSTPTSTSTTVSAVARGATWSPSCVTEGLDFVGAIEWLAERFRVRSSTTPACG